ncbi:aldehyde dehydrogenase family protein [Actinoplanes subtropicus]|uniref:aldehyde dehydrogenase family protein n=1 Tax=Actinoplanes subtropicus TaxID=543632 RepID=UPI00068DD1C5|nr:aldehyde dehydrogenase family protein [Actinoplanes subtropicus]
MTTSSGQLCTRPGLVFVPGASGATRFRAAVRAAVAAVPAAPMLSEHVREAYESGLRLMREHPDTELLGSGVPDPSIAEGGVAHVFVTTAEAWLREPVLAREVFGPAALVVRVGDPAQLATIAERLEGQLAATVHAAPPDGERARSLLPTLAEKAGRIIVNGWPTGVEVGTATVHGGPFPATSDGSSTSVGTLAIHRFLRPVAYQNLPPDLLYGIDTLG